MCRFGSVWQKFSRCNWWRADTRWWNERSCTDCCRPCLAPQWCSSQLQSATSWVCHLFFYIAGKRLIWALAGQCLSISVGCGLSDSLPTSALECEYWLYFFVGFQISQSVAVYFCIIWQVSLQWYLMCIMLAFLYCTESVADLLSSLIHSFILRRRCNGI